MIILEEIRFSDNFSSGNTNWLLDNVGQEVDVEIDILVSVNVVGDNDDEGFDFSNEGLLYPNKVEDLAQLGRFKDFREGDNIQIDYTVSSTNDNVQIIHKESDNVIYVDSTLTKTGKRACEIFVTDSFEGFNFFYNLIENDGAVTYQSKVDGSTQKATFDGVDYTDTVTVNSMQLLGNKSWQYGSATIEGNGGTVKRQKFTIKHTFLITPFFLSEQWDDIQDGLPPDYFETGKCLKYIFKVELSQDIDNPNTYRTFEKTDLLGNTGWFDERFNGFTNNYSIQNVVINDVDSNAIDSVQKTTSQTTMTFEVHNETDTPFSDANTEFQVAMAIAPEDEEEYRDTATAKDRTITENFILNQINNTLGSGSINAGTSTLQMIKTIQTTFVDSGQVDVTLTFEMDSNVVDTRDPDRYLIWLIVQDHTLAREDADRVSLLVDSDEFYVDLSSPDLVNMTNYFVEHPYDVLFIEAIDSIDARTEDDIICAATIEVTDNTDVNLVEAVGQIVAYNTSSGEEFILDEFTLALGNLQKVDGIPYANVTKERGFKTPAADRFNEVRFYRETSIDTGTEWYYIFLFPIIMRWEYWEKLSEVSDDFFDTSEPNNGENHDWFRYFNTANWTIRWRAKLVVESNGFENTYESETDFGFEDYNDDPDWISEEIKTFDGDGNELVSGGSYQVLGYEDTTVKANFTYDGTEFPTIDDIIGVMKINAYEQGNFKRQYTASTEYSLNADTWWKSISVARDGIVYTVTAVLDYTKIQPADQFKMSCRIYDKDLIESIGDLDPVIWYGSPFTVSMSPRIDNVTNNGTGADASQGSITKKPDLLEDQIGNLDAVYFDAVGEYLNANDSYDKNSATPLFNNDFSIDFVVDIDDGRPASDQTLFGCKDINNNIFRVDVLTGGELSVTYGANGTAVIADTDAPLFNDGQTGVVYIRIHCNFVNDQIHIYLYNGTNLALQTLDATNDGDLTGIIFANFECTNNLAIGAHNTGSIIRGSVYKFYEDCFVGLSQPTSDDFNTLESRIKELANI